MELKPTDFEQCPKWNHGQQHSEQIANLHNTNKNIMKELKKFAKDAKKTSKYLKDHMSGEDIHHAAVNTAISGMGKAVTDLLQDKKLRDEAKDKREGIRDKILVAMSVPIIFGIYNFVIDMMAMRQVLTGE